jgi:hypothetical protein
VFARLRHDGLVGGNHEQHRVDPAHSREHVLHEALVARNVHEREIDVAHARVGEPEIDGDPARLLFLQPVGVRSGQRQDERALPVINMPRRPDNNGLHSSFNIFNIRHSTFSAFGIRH